tara:strand:+ start:205 stop:444 length:240 start_codon:yes stop_codon:yes gene_type:complete
MNIEFKDVKNIGDLQKVLSKLSLEPSVPIKVHYQYDLTSSEDTNLLRKKLETSGGNLEFCIHEIRNNDDQSFNIFLRFN